jgi:hypothetical protein
MKNPLDAGRGPTTDRRTSWMRHAAGPADAPGPRPALAAALIVALALVQPASSFAFQAGGDPIGVDTLSTTPDVESPDPPAMTAGASKTPMANRPPVEADMSDVFPFANNVVPESFPSVGFALGVGGCLSSFTSVEAAFHAMEDVYRADGFPVPSARDVEPGPMVMPTLMVRLNPWLEGRFQMGRAGGATADRVTLLGGLVSGRVPLSPAGKVSLLAGLGGGSYRFSFVRSYGARVSSTDANGGYFELETITLHGGGGYWTAGGGLAVGAFPRGALEARIQYVGTGDVTANTTRAGDVRVNMSGAMLSLSIVSFF